MSRISVTCPNGHHLLVSSASCGKTVRCPKCNDTFKVANQETKTADHPSTLAADPLSAPPKPDRRNPPRPQSTKSATKPRLAFPVAVALGGVALVVATFAGLWMALQPYAGGPARDTETVRSGATKTELAIVAADPPQSATQADVERYPRLPGAVDKLPDWISEEAPFDAVDFVNSIPWEDNAAPLYLEALTEFSPETSSCFPPSRVQELRDLGASRTKLYSDFMAQWEYDTDRFKRERSNADNDELDRILIAHHQGFSKLVAAQEKKRCCFETGIGVSALLSHAQGSREVVRMLELKVIRELDRNDFDAALASLEAALRLSRDLQPRGPLVCQLVSFAITNIALKSIAMSILNSPRCSVTHCDRMMKILQHHERSSKNAWATCLQSEYVFLRLIIQQVQDRSGDFAPEKTREILAVFQAKLVGDTPGHLLSVVMSWNPTGKSKRQIDAINARLDLMSPEEYAQEAKSLANWYTKTVAIRQLPFGEQLAALDRVSFQDSGSFFLTLIGSAIASGLNAFQRYDLELRGTTCLVALKRSQLGNANASSDLGKMFESYGYGEAPIDPFSGQPFKLGKVAESQVVYSVGTDGIDDQAQSETLIHPKNPGDIIFKLD